jgi:hypothetical protein
VSESHDGNARSNIEVPKSTERCERQMNECDEQLKRYEKQLKEVQERMKIGETIN